MQAGQKLVPVSYRNGDTRAMALEHGEITERIIGAAFEVYSILGYSFMEKVFPLGASGRMLTGMCLYPCLIRVQSVAKIAFETGLTNRAGVSGGLAPDASIGPHSIPLRSDRILRVAAHACLLAAGRLGFCQQFFRFAHEALSRGVLRPARILHPLA
jgi:hypothetical protein